MSEMQEPVVTGRGLNRKAKVQPVTGMQKFFMGIVGITFVVSRIMVGLDETGTVSLNSSFFSHLLWSTLSAIFGYLFGSNTRQMA